MEVHKTLGPGFLESVYENAMKIELENKGLKCKTQVSFPVIYKDHHIKDFICDMVVDDKVIIELKAIKNLSDLERAQAINYLKVTGIELALLINFGKRSLEYERLVLTRNHVNSN
ncbi:MAG: GxxExxY protein [Candidatus Marinimicrobia bacterium]|nr:GxxExxY protein [Candidatus Neomarinimicrobiota bacterium]